MRLILTLEYDGSQFHGWQIQPGLRTIQRTVEEALGEMMGASVRAKASGRTDAGVHALGQVMHCDVTREIPPENVMKGLNSLLPPDVKVVKCRKASEGFHAQYSATGKLYRYKILNRSQPTALHRDRVWHIRRPLDDKTMKIGASYLVGKKDFAAFKSAGDEGTTIRDLRRIDIVREQDTLTLIFEADGFLKHMVRNITGALVEVGLGRLTPDDVRDVLDSRSRDNSPKKAPPQGLTLVEVFYR
ncbi:tRNA pseudouridine(38-40) synthase TruA [bacterium]|nr:MAG: tRNA pseudouridine(38-40) synthase TruA [bacterium]